jgi:hypothetical protein
MAAAIFIQVADNIIFRLLFASYVILRHVGNRWATVSMVDEGGRRYSVDVCASSTFDAAHLFVAHAKADPRNGIPRPTVNSEFEVVVDGKIHRVTGKALQQWILKQGEERKGPAGYIFSKRPNL